MECKGDNGLSQNSYLRGVYGSSPDGTMFVGMSNPTHFARAFKKLFGVTPQEYIRKHGKTDK
ncbi:MAG: helix-turn-helix transcriptional regulator [Bacteroidales bacterium]|nr:helix-turn-helix transcriptional regulator [Candidatus Liminaster caballi]